MTAKGESQREVGYIAVLMAVVRQAHLDLSSSDPAIRHDAEWFFAPHGGLSQWRSILGIA